MTADRYLWQNVSTILAAQWNRMRRNKILRQRRQTNSFDSANRTSSHISEKCQLNHLHSIGELADWLIPFCMRFMIIYQFLVFRMHFLIASLDLHSSVQWKLVAFAEMFKCFDTNACTQSNCSTHTQDASCVQSHRRYFVVAMKCRKSCEISLRRMKNID